MLPNRTMTNKDGVARRAGPPAKTRPPALAATRPSANYRPVVSATLSRRLLGPCWNGPNEPRPFSCMDPPSHFPPQRGGDSTRETKLRSLTVARRFPVDDVRPRARRAENRLFHVYLDSLDHAHGKNTTCLSEVPLIIHIPIAIRRRWQCGFRTLAQSCKTQRLIPLFLSDQYIGGSFPNAISSTETRAPTCQSVASVILETLLLKIDERWKEMRALTDEQRKEKLSISWIKAMASVAGFAAGVPNPDTDSIDLTLSARGERRPKLDLQIKATGSPTIKTGGLHFRLKRKNYNDLCENRSTPLILVVVELPSLDSDWIDISDRELVLRRRTWWTSLKGSAPIQGNTKTVIIPSNQLLDVSVLIDLMVGAREGTL